MLRFSRMKTIGVVLLTVLGILYAMPSLLSPETRKSIQQTFSFLPSALVPHQAVVLGLDLQGGSHVLLEVDTQAVLRGQINTLRDDVRRILREQRISLAGGIGVTPRGVTVRVVDPNERERLMPKLRELSAPVGNALLGTGSGQRAIEVAEQPDGLIQLNVTEVGVNERVTKAVSQAIEVLRRRVDALGTTEPNIQRQGADRILVQVPGLQDPRRLKEILGTTAQLEFRLLAEPGTPPGDVEVLPSSEGGGALNVERRVIVQGEDLIDAQPAFDSRTGEPIVNFRFNIKGAQNFGRVTTEAVGRPLAIVLDKKVISAPVIQQPITGGSGQISGRFTVEQANNLAILLRAGALPAPLTIVEERTVGPGLGQDSIQAGKHASYVATALVVTFMFVTYGTFGLFANIALFVHVILIFAMMSLIGSTLTLPGIAGIVLTIGTAVDSNVLIYERIREEFHLGRSMISSLEAGFQRAFATIIDSNVTMFIAALILFLLGSGPVKGFAITMIFGIVTTVVTAVTMTRMMIALWYRWAKPTRLPF
ncbi:protein translocase subunit SecD [Alsobacter sp. SYSU M60028]|uniref:Protein translocase subunit SecD n=1 Tax=Alsobacter ponti TaxID=2962936 RepID=A0ABT1LCW0_9HYPH|nr:protein translocase subunit SecD [Alsobacter ponti]MCP8939340.1 protein translocase subunit SecD [Alsobacter ponti]